MTRIQRKLYQLWQDDVMAAKGELGREVRGDFFANTHTLKSIVNHPSTLVKELDADGKKPLKKKGKTVQPSCDGGSSDESEDAGITSTAWNLSRSPDIERPASALSCTSGALSSDGDHATEATTAHDQIVPASGSGAAADAMHVVSTPSPGARVVSTEGAVAGAVRDDADPEDAEEAEGFGSLMERRLRLVKATPEIQTPTPEQSSKMLFALEIIRQASARNEKLIFFAHRLDVLSLMRIFIDALEFRTSGGVPWRYKTHYRRLDGADTAEERHVVAEEFNSPNSELRLLLLSTKAVGLGLNLIGASRVILFDLDWDPTLDTQAIFRTYRYVALSHPPMLRVSVHVLHLYLQRNVVIHL
jgi:SNF2 family DNA or RNA helicase